MQKLTQSQQKPVFGVLLKLTSCIISTRSADQCAHDNQHAGSIAIPYAPDDHVLTHIRVCCSDPFQGILVHHNTLLDK